MTVADGLSEGISRFELLSLVESNVGGEVTDVLN
jgi:hypothetical protein